MISVNVSFIGSDVQTLMVSGHANFAQYGKDIVCAGVSAIVFGGMNALESFKDNVEFIQKENEVGIKVIHNHPTIQIVLNTILIQLETIENSYKNNIKINK